MLKTIRKSMRKLEGEIREGEMKQSTQDTPELRKELKRLRERLQELAIAEDRYLGDPIHAVKYGEGDRPSKTLAWAIRKERPSTGITEIEGDDGVCIRDQEGINERFRQYYEQLYMSQTTPGHDALLQYLDEVALGWLDPEQGGALNKPITEEEVCEAIESLPNGKAPGGRQPNSIRPT